MRRYCLAGVLLAAGLWVQAQGIMKIEDKAFNFGAKVGFSATFPIVNSLSINNKEVTDFDMEYKVGYIASAFCRININRFFLQPSVSWHRSNGNIRFSIPKTQTNEIESATSSQSHGNYLRMKTNALEIPMLLGYHLVRKGHYGLSLMAGPKFKYNYKVAYTIESPDVHVEYINDNTPLGINIATGVGVSIGRLFFDFIYEFGLNQVESDFQQVSTSVPQMGIDIGIDKRTNVMSMALGFLF